MAKIKWQKRAIRMLDEHVAYAKKSDSKKVVKRDCLY